MSPICNHSREYVCHTFLQIVLATLFSFLVVSAARANDCQGEAWLELEIFAGQIAGKRLVQSTAIDNDGCVLTTYADFDIRAGRYQRQLTKDDHQDLLDLLSSSRLVTFNAEAEQRAIATRLTSVGQPELLFIADADLHRLKIHNGKQIKVIEWESPEMVAKQRNTSIGLRQLASFVSQMKRSSADPLRTDAREVSP